MLPNDLIVTARFLAHGSKGRPLQAYLRRSVSTAYYALFHTLAECCANLIVGSAGALRSKPAWNQVYRALEHGLAKQACQNRQVIANFPQQIQDFANMFVSMQIERHDADYDPDKRFFKSAVLANIAASEVAMADFANASLKDRRAFAVWVLLKQRR